MATIHDEASVNAAAIYASREAGDFRGATLLHCLSHALANTGDALVCPTLHEFKVHWHQLMSHSEYAKRFYFDKVGRRAPHITNFTRWYVSWEETRDMLRDFDQLLPFLKAYLADRGRDVPSVSRCIQLLETGLAPIRFEMIVAVEHSRLLCKTCYFLEGDGFLFPYAANKLMEAWRGLDPSQPLTAREEAFVSSFAAQTRSDINVARTHWRGIREAILRPAFTFLGLMLPAQPPPALQPGADSRLKKKGKKKQIRYTCPSPSVTHP